MNEHEQDPSLDPEDEARIRALLADLGSPPGTPPGGSSDDTSMPPEVAARLDQTVARLVAERASAAEEGPEERAEKVSAQGRATVSPLRRRWAARAAGAAAAVIVVGAGGVAAANLGVFGGSATQNDSAGGSSTSGQAESLDKSATPPADPSASQRGLAPANGRVPELGPASFDTRVARLLAPRDSAAQQPNASPRQLSEQQRGDARRAAACPGPSVTDGSQRIPVTYSGQPAVLLVHPASGGDQLVQAWSCSGARLLDSTSVVGSTPGASPGGPGLGSPTSTP